MEEHSLVISTIKYIFHWVEKATSLLRSKEKDHLSRSSKDATILFCRPSARVGRNYY
jgi:hypothetical protein